MTIPVGLYTAVESRGELHFRLLHDKDASPIDYCRFCEEEDVEVAWKDAADAMAVTACSDAMLHAVRNRGHHVAGRRRVARRDRTCWHRS